MSMERSNLAAPRPIPSPSSDGHPQSDPFDAAHVVGLFPGSQRKFFAPREVIYREGDSAQTVFALRSGLVKLVSYSPSGQARTIRLHTKGALLGVLGLSAPTYEHTAIAVSDVEADQAPLRTVDRLKEVDLRQYCRLIEHAYQSLKSADLWITHFSTGCVKARVARLVNFLSLLQHDCTSNEVALLSCEEMAAILGVTTESVSRTLAEFKRSRLLRSLPGPSDRLYERDAQALQRAAWG